MKYIDIKLNENTSFYVKKIQEYFAIDRNIDAFYFCTYVGSYLSEKNHHNNLKYIPEYSVNKIKAIEIGRNTLMNETEQVKYLLFCVQFNLENGVVNNKLKDKLDKIWHLNKLNEDKDLYNHMLTLCFRGAIYLTYEIEVNNTKIDGMMDVLEELLETDFEEKIVQEMEI